MRPPRACDGNDRFAVGDTLPNFGAFGDIHLGSSFKRHLIGGPAASWPRAESLGSDASLRNSVRFPSHRAKFLATVAETLPFEPLLFMIKVDQLSKRYAGFTALDSVSFEVGRGEIVGFLGPNGAGKTTTLRILTNFLPPSSGTATVGGFDVFKDSLKVRQQIGYMPENVPLYNDMRVKEYLRFRSALKGLKGKALGEGVGDAMERCGVHEVRRKMIGTLSKGFRQRVGLADALVTRPPLLILDEPTNGLDPNQIRQVRTLIKELGQDHTVLISTHILSEVEMTCDRVIIINKGTIQAHGTPTNLASQLRSAGTVKVELKGGPEAIEDKLRAIKGVRKVSLEQSHHDWHTFVLRVEAAKDIRESVDRLARDKQWPLRELSRKGVSLEDVFVELTLQQQD